MYFEGRYDQRALVIRTAVTLAGESAITITRFRPSKNGGHIGKLSEGSVSGRLESSEFIRPAVAM